MWHKIETMTVNKFVPYLINVAPDKLKDMRFIYRQDGLIYVAGFDNFSDVMPDGMNHKKEIEVWKWED